MTRPLVDLLGQTLSDLEIDLLDAHRRVESLSQRDDLAPCVESNLKHALAALWQVVTDLDLVYRPETLGDAAE